MVLCLNFCSQKITSIKKPPGLSGDVYTGIPFSSLEDFALCMILPFFFYHITLEDPLGICHSKTPNVHTFIGGIMLFCFFPAL